jgi:hypothetical protein
MFALYNNFRWNGQGQFFSILVAILKITAKLEIPEVP